MGTNNITLNVQKKEKFTINNEEDRFVELNTNDMSILARYGESIPKINDAINKMEELNVEGEDDEAIIEFSTKFKELDQSIRDIVDYIFDYPVSEPCAYGGSMFDLQDSNFRFETIIETLFNLYDADITSESQKLQKRIKSHTDKYLPKDHKRKASK